MDYLGRIITKNPTAPTVGSAKGIWTLDEAMQYQKAGTWPLPQYPFSRSVRTRASASAYLSWTPSASATSAQKLTYSAWIKRGTLGSVQFFGLTGAISGSARDAIRFTTSDALEIFLNEASSAYLATTQLFRDPSAWYHIVVAVDTTQATSSDRIKVYVNGVQVTAFSTATYPTQNYNFTGWLVSGKAQNLARSPEPNYYFDGYMTGVNVVDGQQLSPTSFGAFDATTGVWNPIVYTGTYGTNGFFLSFSDPTSTITLSQDYSGNANNWTANNISLTSGVTYDSMVDTTSNSGTDTGVGGEVRGNYAVLNALDAATAPSDGNLRFVTGGSNYGVRSTIQLPSSGKWYSECILGTTTGASVGLEFGFATAAASLTGGPQSSGKYGIYADTSGYIYSNGTTITSGLGVFSSGTVLQIAYDGATGNAWVGKGNVWYNSSGGTTGNPATGANPTFTSLSSVFVYVQGINGTQNFNAGQTAFSYTAPSGFKALCTQNLPTATVSNGANYMAASIWTGDQTARTITNTVNGTSFQPDFIWTKSRSNAESHRLSDSVRGGNGTVLYTLLSNDTAVEGADTDSTGFVSTGFTIRTGANSPNVTGRTYVGWQWKGGGTGVSNTSGSITSTVSANTAAGFSVLTYTGTGANATVGHGLGVAPSMVIVKKRSAAASWAVWHSSLTLGQNMFLDSTSAAYSEPTMWNSTAPTSTVFSLGTYGSGNTSSATYVAYCFAPISGYSAFGSYVGNGSTDGTFVYCGFRPRWILAKSTSTGYWHMFDSSRPTYNPETLVIYANIADAEATVAGLDFLSNGFKLRYGNAGINGSGDTYIYAAFAENPFTLARAR